MLSIRRFVITFGLVIASFAIAAAQEDKTLNTQAPVPSVAASASSRSALNATGRDERVTESGALVPPAAGNGTRNFIPKWLETGGMGNLGDSVIFDTAGAVGIGTTTPAAKLDVVGDINTTTQYEIGGKRVLSVAGSSNTFVGVEAGEANTTGSINAFFGFRAGNLNTTGQSNSFFGTQAGTQTTTGNFNAFFGTDAGKVNTTGQDNTFFGAFAGDFNTTGGDNSFFGNGAGRSNRTGQNNTLIGKLANVQSGNLSFATAIGSRAIVTTSNSVVLGRPAGEDTVRIPGIVVLRTLGTGGSTSNSLCRNASLQIATCSSSLRYKRDVAPFGGGLSLVRQLRPVTFRWQTDGTLDVGFGAEDVERVAPLFVTRNAEGEIEGVKYGQLSAVLVSAVQEQQTQIAAQQDQIKRQQSQIDSLRKLVCLAHPNAEACN